MPVVLFSVLCCIYLVNGCDFLGVADQRIGGAPFAQHISDQSLLAIVGGQDRDLVARVADEPHVHEESNDVLGLGQVLVEVWLRLRFAHAIVVVDVDELVVVDEAGVGQFELALVIHMLQAS